MVASGVPEEDNILKVAMNTLEYKNNFTKITNDRTRNRISKYF